MINKTSFTSEYRFFVGLTRGNGDTIAPTLRGKKLATKTAQARLQQARTLFNDKGYPALTVFNASGSWEGKTERTYVISVFACDADFERLSKLGDYLLASFEQDAVLLDVIGGKHQGRYFIE